MKNLLFISYYTEGYYEKIINKYLLPSLQKFNLNWYIQNFPNLHSWELNGKYKTSFILERMNSTNKDIVFLDADAEILKIPDLFNNITEDIGIHYLDWWKFWHNNDCQNKFETLTGTIYIKNSYKTRCFINEWNNVNQKSIQWAQKLFPSVLSDYPEITVHNLPIEYCQIIKPDGIIPENTIIAQWQASRMGKKIERNNP